MTRREWFQFGAAPLALVNVRDHGASGKGSALESGAIQAAIHAASAAGGGTVYIPAGRYLCGSIRLKSNISVWLDNGAILVMSGKDSDFDSPEHLDFDPNADT